MLNRTGLLVFFTCALMLCAGIVLGRLWAAHLPAAAVASGSKPDWLADQLKLTPTQRQQMDAIWEETGQKMHKTWDATGDLRKERDQALHNLLSEPQRTQWDQLDEEFHNQRAALDKERAKLIQEADDQSKSLLSEEQKKRWDVLTKDMHGWRGPHGSGTQRSSTRPSTRPTDGPLDVGRHETN